MADHVASGFPERTVRVLRVRVVASLLGLAALALGSYFLELSETQATRHIAAAINMGGRVRMLTQRAALLADELAGRPGPAASEAVRKQLAEIGGVLRSTRDILLAGDASANIPASDSAELRRIYYEPPFTLDARMDAFISEVNSIVSDPAPADSHARAIHEMATSGALLHGLDAAVAQYQKESEGRAARLLRYQGWTLLLSLLSLSAAGTFLFAPMIHRVRRDMHLLADAETYARAIVDTAFNGIIVTDERGVVELFNPAAEKIFGYGAGDVIGRNISMLVPAPHDLQHDGYIRNYLETGRSQVVGQEREVPGRRKDGTIFPMTLAVSELRRGGRRFFVGVLHDVSAYKDAEDRLRRLNETLEQKVVERTAAATERARELEAENEERRHAEAALRESEERFRQMAESISGVFWISDAATDEMIYVNPAYEKVFHRTCASLYQSPLSWQESVHPDDRQRVVAELSRVRAGGGLDHEYCIIWPDGSIRWIRTRIFPVHDALGTICRYTGVSDDITEQRLIQNQTVQSQKLEAIGQLAAGIAHEINTPTQYVGDNIRFLRDGFDDLDRLLLKSEKLLQAARRGPVPPETLNLLDESIRDVDVEYLREEIPKAIEQSLEGTARIAKIVRAMKDFSHPGFQDRVPLDINQAIETTLTVAQNELKYMADIVTRFDQDLPPVPCYPNEINQVVLNILINAADAIADAVGRESGIRGTISVSTAKVDSWAEIRIGDTGAGIPEKIRGRIFDPFFTTKDVGKGTGQGLALSHAIIVEKHQGSITFETDVGRGTTFIIRLPLQPQA